MIDTIFDPNVGYERGLGLVVKPRKLCFRPFAATGLPILSPDEIRKALESKQRARSRYGPDWIKNQRKTNACNGHAAAAALDRARDKRGLPRVSISGASIYSLVNGGEDQGSGLEEGMEALMRFGALTEREAPWNQIYIDPRGQNPNRARFKAQECYQVESEAELATGLANEFVGVVAVHVTNAFYSLNSKGIAGGSSGRGNHAVCVDDLIYDTQLGAFLFDMPNSWDVTYGDQGRAYLTWKSNLASCVNYHGFYLIRGATDDSQGENPPPAV